MSAYQAIFPVAAMARVLGPGYLRLRSPAYCLRLQTRPGLQDGLGSLLRSRTGVWPGLCAPRGRVVSLHDHPGAILHRLSQLHRRAGYGRADGVAAWFEAYLGGEWYTLDARNNIPGNGWVLIAHGRDAADVAISTTFGPNTLSSFRVCTEESRGGRMSPDRFVLSRLRARRWSGDMADDNRRPEHRICGDANKQEDRDHDRRNEVFHGCFLLKTRRRNPARSPARRPPACRQKL
jgi:hypothetical protein